MRRVAPGAVLACAVVLCALPPTGRVAEATRATIEREASEGRLRAQVGDQVVDVPLAHTDVDIRVTGHLAEVLVAQTFRNPYPDKIDALYLFPLPTSAAVHHLEIQVGERKIVGAIAERGEAERIYRRARRRGHVAALLTQERPNLFTQQVANLEPGKEIVVRLRYVQPLGYEAGGYEVVFPMVAPPRYVPESSTTSDADRVQPTVLPPAVRSSHEISLAVTIDAGVPITGITSPSHRIEARPGGASHLAAVKIADSDTIPNKDFVLRYQVAGTVPAFAVLSHRDDGPGSFFLVAQPPAEIAADTIAPREMIFVIDASSSMAGLPLAKAKAVVRHALAAMQPDDTFQIVGFDQGVATLGPALVANQPKNLEYALAWLEKLAAGGTTEMLTGIATALDLPHDPARLRVVVFLTDGFIGNEDEVLRAVGERIGEARLFSFGVGSAVNRYLLEELAEIGRGAATVVRPDEPTEKAVESFYRRIDRPLLTDVRIDWNGLAVTDLVPAAIPDLYAGQPLVLAGHYTTPGTATITIHGVLAGREVAFAVPASFPNSAPERPEIATVWARRRIAELDRQRIRGETEALRREITDLALAHSLMSRYTALVAVDSAEATAGGESRKVVVPVEIPEGVLGARGSAGYASYGAVGGAVSKPAKRPMRLRSMGDDGLDYDGGYGGGGCGGGGGGYAGPAPKIDPVPEPDRHDDPLVQPPVVPLAEVHHTDVAKTAAPRISNAKLSGLRRCMADRVKTNPDPLSGKLTLRIVVGTDGRVRKVEITHSTVTSDELTSCVVGVARKWSFEARTEEATVDVPIVVAMAD